MLTPEQEAWINTLSDRVIEIVSYDPRAEEFFNKVKDKIHNLLGPDIVVEHTGSTVFKIPGSDEVDVAIVTSKERFPEYIPKLETVFGPVRSSYSDRARFEVKEDGKKIDLKIVDKNNTNYLEGKVIDKYLLRCPEDLERYRILKEECDGKTVKEYWCRKTEFMNEILEKAK